MCCFVVHPRFQPIVSCAIITLRTMPNVVVFFGIWCRCCHVLKSTPMWACPTMGAVLCVIRTSRNDRLKLFLWLAASCQTKLGRQYMCWKRTSIVYCSECVYKILQLTITYCSKTHYPGLCLTLMAQIFAVAISCRVCCIVAKTGGRGSCPRFGQFKK